MEIQVYHFCRWVRLAVDPVIFVDGKLWVEFMGDKNHQASLLKRSPLHGGNAK